MSRPTSYTPEIAQQICDHLSEGLSLRSFCSHDGAPSKTTVMRWLRAHAEFRDQYARAREDQAEAHADEIVEIADDGTNDYVQKTNKDGSTFEAFDAEHVQRSKLRIDARKWAAAKLAPKKYGDKTEITGKDGAPLIPPEGPIDKIDLARRLLHLVAEGVRSVKPSEPPSPDTSEPPAQS